MSGVPDEARAQERLREAAEAMVAGVGRALPAWSRCQVARLVAAWGRLDPERTGTVVAEAEAAGEAAARRVSAELTALFELDPAHQPATPLEIVRSAVAEPTAVLQRAGVPEVVRDEFEERAWPEDRYGLTPRSFRDVDDDLAAVHMAWGVAKAGVLRARGSGEGAGPVDR